MTGDSARLALDAEATKPRPAVEVFIDLRSPYSYVAKDLVRAMADDLAVELAWLPFAIDIEAAYGAAEARDARQVAKARYIYMDARRLAEPQGLVIRGPKRIYDAGLAHRGMLFAAAAGVLAPYIDRVYERFFTRDIDIEDREAILSLLSDVGAERAAAAAFIDGCGHDALAAAKSRSRSHGIFGVPSFVYRGELFWGADRLPHLRAAIAGSETSRTGAASP